jgi:hypothetical protein
MGWNWVLRILALTSASTLLIMHVVQRNQSLKAGELVSKSRKSVLGSYEREANMIDEPMDAEDGSLYNAPFRSFLSKFAADLEIVPTYLRLWNSGRQSWAPYIAKIFSSKGWRLPSDKNPFSRPRSQRRRKKISPIS